ncbi:MAG: zf-HC2 domain-containing protein [Clostridia bacterium]|nr:zf-HC2 domain-containing protein [Clostridia bacterium]
MIKNECEIVRDLLPNYIENQIASGTKEFVDGHIKGCKDCKEVLAVLSGAANENETVDEEEKEIDFLKKCNRKIFVLKFVATVIALAIVVMWVIIGINRARVRKQEREHIENGEKIASIIDKSYNAMENILHSDNYKMTYNYYKGEELINQKEVLCKNQYIKSFHKDKVDKHGSYTNYGVIQGDRFFCIQCNEDNNIQSTGKLNFYWHINPLEFDKRHIIDLGFHKIREEKVDEIDYYVVRRIYDTLDVDEEKSYYDVWINKENMLVYKMVHDNVYEIGKKSEEIYTWETDCVTDDDVIFKDLSEKDIEETKQFFYISGFDFEAYRQQISK